MQQGNVLRLPGLSHRRATSCYGIVSLWGGRLAGVDGRWIKIW
jgi:hypothetical protein